MHCRLHTAFIEGCPQCVSANDVNREHRHWQTRRSEAGEAYAKENAKFYHTLCKDEFTTGWTLGRVDGINEMLQLLRDNYVNGGKGMADWLETLINKP